MTDPPEEVWLDEKAGPVVRPYAVSGGRTRAAGRTFDLLAMIAADDSEADTSDLGPEHRTILGVCERATSVADLAAEIALPLGVLRVLLGDLHERGLVVVRPPAPAAETPDPAILEEVLHGLRDL